MADRGFLIEDSLRAQGGRLQIPAFTKGKVQLYPTELESTRKIGNLRIHVERIIGQLRLKYPIIARRKFPMSMFCRQNGCDAPVVDQIVLVCSALINLCRPIVVNPKNDT